MYTSVFFVVTPVFLVAALLCNIAISATKQPNDLDAGPRLAEDSEEEQDEDNETKSAIALHGGNSTLSMPSTVRQWTSWLEM